MKVEISKIKIAERIRKSVTHIRELAENIEEHGLINAITVMPGTVDGEYQLLAGLRRLKAAKYLGWTEIKASVLTPSDAEEALLIEISENEQREEFNSQEKLDYGRQLERLEVAKARERMSQGGKGGAKQGVDDRPTLRTRETVGKQIGMSGRNYDRLKYIGDTAPELLEQIDNKQHSINSAYEELRAKEKASVMPVPDKVPEIPKGSAKKSEVAPPPAQTTAKLPDAANPAAQLPSVESGEKKAAVYTSPSAPSLPRVTTPDPAKPVDRVTELEQLLRTERSRAATAESQLARDRELWHNDVLHRDSTIQNLKLQLKAAHEKIQELEDKFNAKSD